MQKDPEPRTPQRVAVKVGARYFILTSGYIGMQSSLFDNTFPQYSAQIAVAK